MHSVNKKNMEVLVKAGAFDGVGTMHRAQYFYKENDLETTPTYLDQLVRWAIRKQDGAASNQMSIFSMSEELAEDAHPPIPDATPWTNIERCRYEKEVVSTYLSGHPLDDYRFEVQAYTNIGVDQLNNLEALDGREVKFAGMVSGVKEMVSKKGDPFGNMMLDDYSGSYELKLFGQEYTDFRNFFIDNTFIYCRGVVRTSRYTDKKSGLEKTFTKLKITSMMPLGGVMDKYTAQLGFNIRLADVNEAFCLELQRLARQHKGNVPLRAVVLDPERNLQLTMSSQDLRVSAREIMPELLKLPGVFDMKPIPKS